MGKQLNHRISGLLVCIVLKLASADLKDDVCKDITPNNVDADNVFSFEHLFKFKVEAVTPDRIFHADTYFFNGGVDLKTMRINVQGDGLEIHAFHDYSKHETSTYTFPENKPRTCTVDPKMRGGNGYYIVPDDTVEGNAPKASELLRLSGSSGFGNDIQLQKMKDSVTFRSVTCRQYVSCQKIFDENNDEMVVKVTHLVSDTKFTKSVSGTVPIQITLEGKYGTGTKQGQDVKYSYNIYHYETIFDLGFLEFPLGVVCEDKKRMSDFPPIPKYIAFGQEVHYPKPTKKIETIETVFDKDLNYVQETYFNQDGEVREKRLDDFKAGLTYRINYGDFTCDVTKISDAPKVNDFVQESDGSIQMVTPEQFFHSGGIQFYYNGERRFGYFLTEEWSGKDKNTGKIYSWFFTKNIEDSLNKFAKGAKDPNGNSYRIPFKRMVWDDEKSKPTSTYFYKTDFTKQTIRTLLYKCFPDCSGVYLYLPGLVEEQVIKDKQIVEHRMMKTLVDALQVSALRITGMFIDFHGDIGFAHFSLCELPTVKGDTIQGGAKTAGISKKLAMARLEKKLKDPTFFFNVGNEDILIETGAEIIENPYLSSYRPMRGKQDNSKRHSTGAMAGLAIGMTLLGLIIGGAVGFWFFFKRG